MTISRILVPTDFSPHADAAFRYARELARFFRADIHLLHVVDNPIASGMWSSEIYTNEIARLQLNLLRDAEERLKRSVPPDAENVSIDVRSGNPTAQILDVALERRADLIVMGTHGRTGVAHVLMGSVAERVLRRAPCPVLTLRQTAVSEAAHVA
jgi:nucleotide-binding universal stress UspA family protein